MPVVTILLVVALILFLMAAINWPNPSPVALGWLAMFFYVLAQLVGVFK